MSQGEVGMLFKKISVIFTFSWENQKFSFTSDRLSGILYKENFVME